VVVDSVVVVLISVVVVASVVVAVVVSGVGGLVLVVGFPVVDVPWDVVPVVPVPGPVVTVRPGRVVPVLPIGATSRAITVEPGGRGTTTSSPVSVSLIGAVGGILAGDVRPAAARYVGGAGASLAARPSIIRVRPTASNTSNTNPPATAVPTCA
jgi:hypothetical protein